MYSLSVCIELCFKMDNNYEWYFQAKPECNVWVLSLSFDVLCAQSRIYCFKCRNVISISACGTMSHNDFQMLLLRSQVIVLTCVFAEQSQRAPLFPFLCYLHIPCCMFPYCYLWTMLEHLSKLLPNGEKRWIWIRERNISPVATALGANDLQQ